MEIEYIVIGAAISINSFILLLTTLFSYRKYKNRRLLFVMAVFLFFFIRGILLSLGLFFDQLEFITAGYPIWLIDVIILNLLYISALKR